jgi:hypothetical protein
MICPLCEKKYDALWRHIGYDCAGLGRLSSPPIFHHGVARIRCVCGLEFWLYPLDSQPCVCGFYNHLIGYATIEDHILCELATRDP